MRHDLNITAGDELHEECGVFGMYDFDHGDVASTIYYGLFALQHRGQESCGIAILEWVMFVIRRRAAVPWKMPSRWF